MKKSAIYLIVSFLLVGISCKKGEEDPFLSLSTRKARISGDWTMSEIVFNETLIINGVKGGDLEDEKGNSEKITGFSTFNDETYPYEKDVISYEIRINKNGEWTKTVEHIFNGKRPAGDDIESIDYTGHELRTQSGTWSFVHKTKGEYKNKERVNLSILEDVVTILKSKITFNFEDGSTLIEENNELIESVRTYKEGENNLLYDIVMLKSKEMKWKRAYASGNNVDYETNDFDYNETYELNEEIIWHSK